MADPITRLRIALRVLAGHIPELPDPDGHDGVVALQRTRYGHLAELEQALTEHRRHDGLRTEDLLAWHCVAQMWLEDLAGQPGLETATLPQPDRAQVDLVMALLLWHLAARPHGFHPTQRLVQLCLRDIALATAPRDDIDDDATPRMRTDG